MVEVQETIHNVCNFMKEVFHASDGGKIVMPVDDMQRFGIPSGQGNSDIGQRWNHSSIYVCSYCCAATAELWQLKTVKFAQCSWAQFVLCNDASMHGAEPRADGNEKTLVS